MNYFGFLIGVKVAFFALICTTVAIGYNPAEVLIYLRSAGGVFLTRQIT
jgi:hypothetical protein